MKNILNNYSTFSGKKMCVDFIGGLVVLTFSCLKKQSILSSRNTRLEETSDWNTLGSFLSATRRPSRGSVTALTTIQYTC